LRDAMEKGEKVVVAFFSTEAMVEIKDKGGRCLCTRRMPKHVARLVLARARRIGLETLVSGE